MMNKRMVAEPRGPIAVQKSGAQCLPSDLLRRTPIRDIRVEIYDRES
jgi:hypothetical protein